MDEAARQVCSTSWLELVNAVTTAVMFLTCLSQQVTKPKNLIVVSHRAGETNALNSRTTNRTRCTEPTWQLES